MELPELIESDNNLTPFFNIGIKTGQDDEDTRITIYTDETQQTIRRILDNGLKLNSPNSNLVNSFYNKTVRITASGKTGAGYFIFSPFQQRATIMEVGKKYAIIFDVEGNPSVSADLIGFIANDTIAGIYNPATVYKNIAANGSNLNCYYIFTADSTIINSKKQFVFGWSNLTGLNIDIKLLSMQLYCIDNLTTDVSILSNLKGTTFCEVKIGSPVVSLPTKFEENGIITDSEFIES